MVRIHNLQHLCRGQGRLVHIGLLCSLILWAFFGATPELYGEEREYFSDSHFSIHIDEALAEPKVVIDIHHPSESATLAGEQHHSIFLLENPPRLVIDTPFIEEQKKFQLNSFENSEIVQLRGAPFEGAQRIVLELQEAIPLSIQEEKQLPHRISLSLGFGNGVTEPSMETVAAQELTLPVEEKVVLKEEETLSHERASFLPTDFPLIEEDPREIPLVYSEQNFFLPKQQLDQVPSTSSSERLSATPQKIGDYLKVILPPLFATLHPVAHRLSTDLSSLSLMLLILVSLLIIARRAHQPQEDARSEEHSESLEKQTATRKTEIIELPTLVAAYRTLRCAAEDSDKKVKQNYRRLLQAFHADKLAGKDLSDELVELSQKEFHRVRAAYERVRIDRAHL
ncbi:hypothetical protein MRY87_07225 [bacterium]|nr:hypothetical protein [bacterium]